LPSGNLVVENGLVQFLETNPDRPVLNLIGNTRMLGYDISVIMEGPYDEPVITLTSSPPLANEDLLMLVLTGTPPPASGRAFDKGARNLNVAVYVGRDLLARWFSGENGNSTESILDRFEAEMGRDITQQGEETLEARFRLLEGLFQERDTLYITGERDVYDYYNAGLRIVFRFR
jgi:translocation and assembly module TamB